MATGTPAYWFPVRVCNTKAPFGWSSATREGQAQNCKHSGVLLQYSTGVIDLVIAETTQEGTCVVFACC